MIGYHYTSYQNWLEIQQTGLRPYHIPEEKLDCYFPGGVQGIWLWKSDLTHWSHVGTILFQVGSKGVPHVVKLRCQFRGDALLRWGSKNVVLGHRGAIGEWMYHADEPACIVMDTIKPKNIRLAGEYDLVKLLA